MSTLVTVTTSDVKLASPVKIKFRSPSSGDTENRIFEVHIQNLIDAGLWTHRWTFRGHQFIMWIDGPWRGRALAKPVITGWEVNRVKKGQASAICRGWAHKLDFPIITAKRGEGHQEFRVTRLLLMPPS